MAFSPALVSLVNRGSSIEARETRLSAAADDRSAPDRASRSAPRATLPPVTVPAVVNAALAPLRPTTTAAPTTGPPHTHPPTTRATTTAPTTAAPAKAPATTAAPKPTTTTTAAPKTSAQNGEAGKASWYAAGTPGNCAHRTLPKGTTVLVSNLANGRTATCKVADRGPYVDGRIIDLALVDFELLAGKHVGLIDVIIQW
ncbi:MAG: septal ring lytic transglycosylase RlpA family protein [Acidimicrobiales bacterium]